MLPDNYNNIIVGNVPIDPELNQSGADSPEDKKTRISIMIKISVMFPVTYNKSDPGLCIHTRLFFWDMSDNGNQTRAFGIRLVTIYQKICEDFYRIDF